MAWANLMTRVAMLWIRLEADGQNTHCNCAFSYSRWVSSLPETYLILACTVSESSRFMGSGVTDPEAMQLVPGRLIFMEPFP